MELAIQTAVLDRRRHLTGHRRQQTEILAVERFVGFLSAEREHGDGAPLEDAGHEVVRAGVPPEFHFFGDEPRARDRIVECDRMSAVQTPQHRRGSQEARHRLREPVVANRAEITRLLVGQHQRHPVHDERFDDARDEPLAETDDVEVGVQVAREGDERAAVVVAIAVEHAVERVLDGLLHRPREEHDNQRCKQRDNPVVVVGVADEHKTGDLADAGIQHDARRQERRVGQPALHDHLDVAQTVPDNGRREGQRHEQEQDRRELQLDRRVDAKRPGQRIPERKRPDAERRAPRDPTQLPPRRDGRDLSKRAHKHAERGGRADEQVDRLGPIEHVDQP